MLRGCGQRAVGRGAWVGGVVREFVSQMVGRMHEGHRALPSGDNVMYM